MRYRPALSVTAVRTFSISAGLAASTLTPGSTAPDASFTEPAILACAHAAVGANTHKATAAAFRNPRMQFTSGQMAAFVAALSWTWITGHTRAGYAPNTVTCQLLRPTEDGASETCRTLNKC